MVSLRLPLQTSLAAALALAWAVRLSSLLADSYLDQIGVTQLRLDTNNAFLGQGVTVAQPEAANSSFEIDPSAAGTSAPITYVYDTDAGYVVTSSYDSSLYSWHAGAVAANLAGTSTGVAPNLSMILNFEANFYIDFVLQNVTITYQAQDLTVYAPSVINQSFIENPDATFTAPILNQFFDNYVASYNYIIVSAAGNGGDVVVPGTADNVITVGAFGGSSSVSRPGQPAKPDLVAPASATSFSTPYVSGIAAILVQAAGTLDGQAAIDAVDPRVVKALLLTGATKPPGWSHSPSVPLDRAYGAGIVNADNSYFLLMAGEHPASSTTLTASLGGGGGGHPAAIAATVGPAGWNLASLASNAAADAVDHYTLDLSRNNAIVTLTATLTWLRADDPALTNEWLANLNNDNFTNSGFTSAVNTINNLDLFLVNAATQSVVDLSVSTIDNVEHLFTLNLTPGVYDLQVLKNGGTPGSPNVFSDAETYALAWTTGTQATVSTASPLQFTQSTAVTIATPITGTGGLSQIGPGTTTLSGPANYSGLTTISAGKLVFSGGVEHSIAGVTGSGTLQIDPATALTSDGIYMPAGSLAINGTLTIRSNATTGTAYPNISPATPLPGTSKVSSLAFASTTSGQLDIKDNGFIVQAANSTSKATLMQQITTETHTIVNATNSFFNIISSTAATLPTKYTIAVVDNADLNALLPGGSTSFGGLTVDTNSILLTQALQGDGNLDGSVDLKDFNIWFQHVSQSTYSYAAGDFNGDGHVDLKDFNIWLQHVSNNVNTVGIPSLFTAAGLTGTTGLSGLANPTLGTTNPVPEPLSLLLLTPALLFLLRRPKQK